jgi:hypothetical protein
MVSHILFVAAPADGADHPNCTVVALEDVPLLLQTPQSLVLPVKCATRHIKRYFEQVCRSEEEAQLAADAMDDMRAFINDRVLGVRLEALPLGLATGGAPVVYITYDSPNDLGDDDGCVSQLVLDWLQDTRDLDVTSAVSVEYSSQCDDDDADADDDAEDDADDDDEEPDEEDLAFIDDDGVDDDAGGVNYGGGALRVGGNQTTDDEEFMPDVRVCA